ncbi:MAG: YeeE/YedE family protein [Aestuariivirga sp.]
MLMQRLSVLVSGLLFGAGLTISGMVNPAKVINFLDFAGKFDATLLFVFAAGVAVAMIGYYFTFKRPAPFFGERFHLPTVFAVDRRLLIGAAIFGIGWGLTGYCPGPAIASLAYLQPISFVFLVAMAVGALAANLVPEE